MITAAMAVVAMMIRMSHASQPLSGRTVLGEFCQRLIDGCLGPAPDNDIGPGFKQRTTHHRANDAGTAGDNGGFSLQPEQIFNKRHDFSFDYFARSR
jgi:hypothetical protein